MDLSQRSLPLDDGGASLPEALDNDTEENAQLGSSVGIGRHWKREENRRKLSAEEHSDPQKGNNPGARRRKSGSLHWESLGV